MSPALPAESEPLTGLKVIELTHMVMGPAAGAILAELGAEVVRIEPVTGDPTRHLQDSGAGYLAIARRLISLQDVLLENFRPGTLDRLGLDYESLRHENPRLIYCSEKGFLPGPYEQRTALDEVAQMMSGLACMTGPPGSPLRAGASVVDVTGGMFAVIAVLAALLQRQASGHGQKVSSALFETSVYLVGQHMAQKAVTGRAAQPMPVRISAWAIYDIFQTRDGAQLFLGVVSDSQWQRFCAEFGLDDLASDARYRTNNLPRTDSPSGRNRNSAAHPSNRAQPSPNRRFRPACAAGRAHPLRTADCRSYASAAADTARTGGDLCS
jgi:crotonobetainyl-CoA:carnitine CoA-transferase CaiB-like acyl-CoA transferase